jgi:hypothetical protein
MPKPPSISIQSFNFSLSLNKDARAWLNAQAAAHNTSAGPFSAGLIEDAYSAATGNTPMPVTRRWRRKGAAEIKRLVVTVGPDVAHWLRTLDWSSPKAAAARLLHERWLRAEGQQAETVPPGELFVLVSAEAEGGPVLVRCHDNGKLTVAVNNAEFQELMTALVAQAPRKLVPVPPAWAERALFIKER